MTSCKGCVVLTVPAAVAAHPQLFLAKPVALLDRRQQRLGHARLAPMQHAVPPVSDLPLRVIGVVQLCGLGEGELDVELKWDFDLAYRCEFYYILIL